jgi:2-hydroxychromene-2-carboxylate isomerase
MSTPTIEVFFSYQSPYSYLALDAIYDIKNKFDVELIWQPFSAKAAGQQVSATSIMPDKISYIFEDTKRFADENNIPLNFPEGWPETEFDPNKVTRGAIVALDKGVLMEYNYKVFYKWWGLGENPNEDNFFNELAQDIDIEYGEFVSKSSASDTRERIKGIHSRGRSFRVFDTPTFIIGKERIVGLDKIPYLRERLARDGFAKSLAA